MEQNGPRKPIELWSLKISRIIVHDIPKHPKGNKESTPIFSDKESKLSDGLRSFFTDKVITALSSENSFKICFRENNVSPVYTTFCNMFGPEESDFVDQSKNIGQHLFDIQLGHNAAGLLVVILGKVNDNNTCILLKLERDKGAQLTHDKATNSFNIGEVKNLMLTGKTKVFKLAMLVFRKDFNILFDGMIIDYQINMKVKRKSTTWFMDKFLGCVSYEDPKITTQNFYHLTREYINTLDDEMDKAKYTQDLNSYLQMNSITLSPDEFASNYFRTTEHKNSYKNYLKEKNFNPSTFIKDISRIENFIKKITLTFENGISLVGSDGTLDDKVKLEKLPDGQIKAEITSNIRKIG